MTTAKANMLDYEAERQQFRWEAPDEFNFAVDVIGKWAADPQKEAMWWVGHDGQERHVTFAEFARRSNQAADAFSKLGIQKGDRVLVMLPRLVEWWEVVLGLMKLGAVPIPCTVLLTPKDIQFRAETAQAYRHHHRQRWRAQIRRGTRQVSVDSRRNSRRLLPATLDLVCRGRCRGVAHLQTHAQPKAATPA